MPGMRPVPKFGFRSHLIECPRKSEPYREERDIRRGLTFHTPSVCRLSDHWALCFHWHRVHAAWP
jgi:hypothetical protein